MLIMVGYSDIREQQERNHGEQKSPKHEHFLEILHLFIK